jgi:hypothetical protein
MSAVEALRRRNRSELKDQSRPAAAARVAMAPLSLADHLLSLEPGSPCFSCGSNLVARADFSLSSGRRCPLVCPRCGAEVDELGADELWRARSTSLTIAA